MRVCFGVILLFLPCVYSQEAFGEKIYVFMIQKAEAKKKTRWTLKDWLATKDRMRLMDLWLAFNSPSPFEFFIGGEYQAASKGGHKNGWRGQAAAYASIVGLEGEYESRFTRLLGTFNFRIFGFHYQSTNLTFRIGLKSEERPQTYRNMVIGGNFTLYFMKFFGVEFLFHYFHDSFSGPSGNSLSGIRYESSVFIDFSFFRVYGTYIGEDESIKTSSATTKSFRSTFSIGSKLFF